MGSEGSPGWVWVGSQMARSRGQPVSPSLPGCQLSLGGPRPPMESEVCILVPGVLARMLWEAHPHQQSITKLLPPYSLGI